MLAPVIPRGVHQLDRVERAAARPRSARRVRSPAVKGVLNRHEPAVVRGLTVSGRKIIADVTAQHDVNIFEQARADEESLCADEFFSDAGKELDRALKLATVHQLL